MLDAIYNDVVNDKESNELMGNHILRPTDVSQLFRRRRT